MLTRLGLSRALMVLVLTMIFAAGIQSVALILSWRSQSQAMIAETEQFSRAALLMLEIESSVSNLHSAIPDLFIEKDPDKLEGKIKAIQDATKAARLHLEECKDQCVKLNDIFTDYDKKALILVNEKILFGKNAEAIEFFIVELSPLYTKMMAATNGIAEELKKKMGRAIDGFKVDEKTAIAGAVGALALIILVMLAFGYLLKNSMVRMVNGISVQLEKASGLVSQTAQELAGSGRELAESGREQAAAVQETSVAMEQISSTVAKTVESIKDTQKTSEASVERISIGKNAIQDMLNSIQRIAEVNEGVVQQLQNNDKEFQEVVGLINQISDRTKVVNDIAFQTKLLSFNASVEAARAGEAGKGFAVVAEEIGNLAAMSGSSAKEITELLSVSHERVISISRESKTRVVEIVEKGRSAVADGSQKAESCDEVFNEISTDANNIQSILAVVTQGLVEQAKGVEEVNKAMSLLDSQAQSGAKVATETAGISNNLENQSHELGHIVVGLKSFLAGSRV